MRRIDDSVRAEGIRDGRKTNADVDGVLPMPPRHNLYKRLACMVVPGDRNPVHALGAERFEGCIMLRAHGVPCSPFRMQLIGFRCCGLML